MLCCSNVCVLHVVVVLMLILFQSLFFIFLTWMALWFSAPTVKGSGECGVLYLAEPLNACAELTNKAEQPSNASSPFVLMVRGGCSFEEKVRRAQKAGFEAVIVYDNENDGVLVVSNDQFLHLATYCCLIFSSNMQFPLSSVFPNDNMSCNIHSLVVAKWYCTD